jgi:uncharacterized protein YndB with AHSA1/START domain
MVRRQMIPSQIEKEVLIEAPIEVVWRVVTEPDQITQWFSSKAEIEGRSGGEGRVVFEQGETYYLQVEAFEPPHRFAYRWLHDSGARPRPDNSMLVEFTLHDEAGKTRLRVVESGFDQVDWADEEKAKYAEGHTAGWELLLGRLRDYAVRLDAGIARE